MGNNPNHSGLIPQAVAASALVFAAALLGVWAIPGYAAQNNSGTFAVTINLQGGAVGTAPAVGGSPAAPATVLCRSGSGVGAFGSTLTVVCATGVSAASSGDASSLPWTTVPDSSYRYMLDVYRGQERLGTVDSYTEAGTITSWRLIKLNNQDYLEMMLHW